MVFLTTAFVVEEISSEQPGVVEQIEDEILEIFGISMSDLADFCRVSRCTPYNWRKNESSVNRKKPGMARLFKVSQAAKNWRNSGFVQPGDFIDEPVVDERSLRDLLCADEIDLEAIQFLGSRLAIRNLGDSDLNNPFT